MRDDLHAVRDSGGEHRRQVDVPASRLAGSIPSGNSDVAIYLLGLAEMTGVDLQDEIEAKMAKNDGAHLPAPAERRSREEQQRRRLAIR